MCRHCPLPTVYDGRIRIVGADTVLADIEQLVAMGARHITFGDPDFLNGVKHSLAVVRAMHERWPWLTFDATVKVEHVLEHAHVWPEFARSGCLFVDLRRRVPERRDPRAARQGPHRRAGVGRGRAAARARDRDAPVAHAVHAVDDGRRPARRSSTGSSRTT